MSDSQLFCYSDKCGIDHTDSYQQKPYRVFNKQLTKEEFEKIKIPKLKLEFDKNEHWATRYQSAFKKAWSEASNELKQEFYNIPHFDWEIFTKITGVESRPTPQSMIIVDGNKYQLIQD